MSHPFEAWFNELPGFSGLFAGSLTLPDQKPLARSWSSEFKTSTVANLQRQAADVIDVLQAGKLPARKLRWIFGRTVVYFERRLDGADLCLITSHDLWVGEGEAITTLISDFRTFA